MTASATVKVEKTTENAASNGFASNLSGAAFCLQCQLVGFLLKATSKSTIVQSEIVFGYDSLNQRVLRRRRKTERDGDVLTSTSNLF